MNLEVALPDRTREVLNKNKIYKGDPYRLTDNLFGKTSDATIRARDIYDKYEGR